jgi:hypothetical protein
LPPDSVQIRSTVMVWCVRPGREPPAERHDRLKGDETVLEGLRREIREEACAELLDAQLLGHQVGIELDWWAQAKLLAKVRLDDFDPQHEHHPPSRGPP